MHCSMYTSTAWAAVNDNAATIEKSAAGHAVANML